MTHLRRSVLMACSLSILCPAFVQAQINPFRSSNRAGLRPDDIKLMDSASSKLLARPDLSVGSTEAWSNDSTGASGTVSVEDTAVRRGITCHRVNYATTQRGGRHRNTVVNWCKTTAGWKIS
jgi:hypothetical protein